MNNIIKLPWFGREVSPNFRGHWAPISKAKKQHRELAYIYTKNADIKLTEERGFVLLNIEFAPPSRRRIDLDNCIASCKAYFDGIADALGVDDSTFRLQARMSDDDYSGCIKIMVE